MRSRSIKLTAVALVLLTVFSVVSVVFPPRLAYADPTCAYIVRTPSQGDIDNLLDNFPFDSNDPLIQGLERRKSNNRDWLYIYCRPAPGESEPEQFILTSEDFRVDRSLQFVSLFNPNNSFAVTNGDWDKLNGIPDSIADTNKATAFIAANDSDGDNVPDDAEPPAVDGDPAPVPDSPDDSADSVTPDDCRDTLGGAIAWAVCAGIEWVDSSINELLQTLNNLLSVNRSEVETAEMRKAWSFFRNIASLLLVVIGLIMIIGQAVSKE